MSDGLWAAPAATESFALAVRGVTAGESVALFGLSEGFRGYVVSAVAQAADRRILLITPNAMQAKRLSEDISQWLSGACDWLAPREIRFAKSVSSHETDWRRLEALRAFLTGKARVLCVPIEALMNPMASADVFMESVFSLKPGDDTEPGALIRRLVGMGYERVDIVEGKGQCAMRGAIIDVFVPSESDAFRFEFFDTQVDSIRTFDCMSQRTLEMIAEATLVPAGEIMPISDEAYTEEDRITGLEGYQEEALPDSASDRPGASVLPPLPEDSDELPDFFDGTAVYWPDAAQKGDAGRSEHADAEALRNRAGMRSLQDNLNGRICRQTDSLLTWFSDALVIIDKPDEVRDASLNRMNAFVEELKSALIRGDAVPQHSGLLYAYDDVIRPLKSRAFVTLSDFLRGMGGLSARNIIEMNAPGTPSYHSRMKELAGDIRHRLSDGFRVLLLSGGVARGKRLSQTLGDQSVDAAFYEDTPTLPDAGQACVVPLTLSKGFIWPEAKLAVIADNDIFGAGYRKSRARSNAGERIAAFTDLNTGDYVVHENHGVGVYRGMVRLQTEGTERDYLFIQYLGNDKLYVPAEQLDRVQRFIGAGDAPPKLNRLGGGDWQRQRNKVKSGLKAMAFDLVKLYAERTARKGHAFSANTPWQRQFEDLFPYELTPDQERSMQDIERDMEAPLNMDRLLCGDVGYGKTEVALRASFKALMDSKQVAFLAPTTILAQQHFHTIRKRFESFPVSSAMLSRFLSPREQRDVINAVQAGKVDILVGTHRLLGSDVAFHDLGLLIVDEEHRFGVAHKEVIKHIKSSVDVLTLSATPIPRTLHMSMVGIRDMSLLETPPEERYPVQTYVTEYSDAVVRDAVVREIGRGGQVYFLYNRVQSIDHFYTRLKALIPEARIGVAHGQMREQMLEDVMMDFFGGAFDVLLCTTIIESGLDIPLANTLIVFDADRFGLSQLYQLRGRVGRSNRQAYAYFTVRPEKMITESAHKRLSAIREFTEFGAGFRIAMRDLEIRGAGNILGPEQHGHLSAIGYDMYCKLVEEALREARGEKGVPAELDTRVDLRIDAYLPEDYVPDERQRLEMYKRIAGITNQADHEDIRDELVDRFGDTPEPVQKLMDVAHLRGLAARLGIVRVTWRSGVLVMRFDEQFAPDPFKLFDAILKSDSGLTLSAAKPPALLLRGPKKTQEALLIEATVILEKLIGYMEQPSETVQV